MSRHEYDNVNDPTRRPMTHLSPPSPDRHRHRPRESQHRRSRRHERSQSQPQPILGMPSPVPAVRGGRDFAQSQTVLSPPLRDGTSPNTEIALLPGGGVEIPAGFRFDHADEGRYRARAGRENGEDERHHVLGIRFGMFKGLKKFPAALAAKAGRGARTRQDASPTVENRGNLPIDEDVDTYVTFDDHEAAAENRAREEQLLREYTRRRHMRRDHAYRRSERVRREPYVPAPQPVPLPGSHTPAPSATGHSEAHRGSAEAEELEEEREALARAQERERSRNVYAAEAVKPPSSVSYAPNSQRTHHRSASVPPPPLRVFSRWAAQRDSVGGRVENYGDGLPASSTSPLSYAGLVRLIRQIRDMPWVGDRVAADYIPGGLRPPSEYTSTTGYPGSPSGTSYTSPVQALPPPLAQSWYAPRDSVLVLPEGVAPPPGFIPYPNPEMVQREGLTEFRVPSTSSNTHVEAPVPVHPSGPDYVESGRHHFMPAEASETGRSYVFIPTNNGRDGARHAHTTGR